MPPKRLQKTTEDEVSSPDPLSFSGRESAPQPATPKRRTSSRKRQISISQEFTRSKSPAKTVIIDPESDDGKSPYRIRVTVQAEPRDGDSVEGASPARAKGAKWARTRSQSPIKVNTTTVPLRDDDDGRRRRSGTPAPKRRRATPRKSMTLAQINDWYDGTFQPGHNFPKPANAAAYERPLKYGPAIQPASEDDHQDDAFQNVDESHLDSLLVEPSTIQSSPIKQSPRWSPRRSPRKSLRRDAAIIASHATDYSESDADDNIESPDLHLMPSTESDQPPPVDHQVNEHAQQMPASTRRALSASRRTLQSASANKNPSSSPLRTAQVLTAASNGQRLSSIPFLEPQAQSRKSGRISFSPLPSRVSNDLAHYPNLPPISPVKSWASETAAKLSSKENAEPTLGELNDAQTQLTPTKEQTDTNVTMNGTQIIGDETMMKSMDMTIVSPSALYSRLDVQSSILHGTPATNKSKVPIHVSEGRVVAPIHEAADNDNHLSPRVQWSSPLILQDEKHTPNNAARPTRSMSHSGRSQDSQPPFQTQGRQLPTPDSDEVDKENTAPALPVSDGRNGGRGSQNNVVVPHFYDAQSASSPSSQHSRNGHSGLSPAAPQRMQSSQIDNVVASQSGNFEIVDISDDSDSEVEEEPHQQTDPASDYSDNPTAGHVEESDKTRPASAEIASPGKDPRTEETMDLWQQAAEHTSSFFDQSQVSERPTVASFRAGQRSSRPRIASTETAVRSPDAGQSRKSTANSTLAAYAHDSPLHNPQMLESPASADKPSENNTIAQLFEAAFRQSHDKHADRSDSIDPSVEDGNEYEASQQDLSAMLRRKVASTMANIDFSLANVGAGSQESRPVSALANAKDLPGLLSRLSPVRTITLPHSPKRSSPLKHRLDKQEDETCLDQISMLSDVQQLQNEQRDARRYTMANRKPQQRSLLKLTQERQARSNMRNRAQQSSIESSMIGDSVIESTDFQDQEDPEMTRDISRLRSFSSVNDSSSQHRWLLPAFGDESIVHLTNRPTQPHRLLKSFRQLPRMHPWTDNHFQALLSLYKHWKSHESQYSVANPANAGVLTPAWTKYIDMELYNWGYELKLTSSLVMVAALFSQLLQLEDADAYELKYGQSIRYGVVAERTFKHGSITEWHIILRLCTVILGDVIRNEEAKGVEIDRRPALKWRLKGQLFWRRGWFAGIF